VNQIGLPFDWSGQGGDGIFIVSAANHLAASHIESWQDWPTPVSILSGPRRSGRSSLARQFERLSGGVVLDDVEAMSDEAIFHAWNEARDSARPLLLVSQAPPALWDIKLPDLRSRIASAPHVRIEEPDDALVRALLEAGFHRAGSAFAADVIDWLARRMERSYAAVDTVLGLLNQASLSSGRKISVPFAKEALQRAGFLPIVGLDGTQDDANGGECG